MRFVPQTVPQGPISTYAADEFKRVADAVRFFFNDGPNGIVIEHDGGERAFQSLPGAESSFYWSGAKKGGTTEFGLLSGNGVNKSPNTSGDGHLKLNGSGYSGYLTLDGTAMYVGHNSASRNLVFQIDEADKLKLLNTSFEFRGSDGNPYFSIYGSDGNRDFYIQATSTSYLWIGENHGNAFALQGEDAGGALKNIIAGDPDGNAYLYYAGNNAFYTQAAGVVVQHPTSDQPALYFHTNAGVRNGFFIHYAGASGNYWRNEGHGGPVRIEGENASGTVRTILQADPDDYTDIYAAGYLGIRIGNATLGFFNSSGNAKQTVTGSKGGNAALANLISVLVNHGLLTDGTT